MQAEVIKVWLRLVCELGEFGMAADAYPHGLDCTPEDARRGLAQGTVSVAAGDQQPIERIGLGTQAQIPWRGNCEVFLIELTARLAPDFKLVRY